MVTGTAALATIGRGALVLPEPEPMVPTVVVESVLVAANEGAANDRVSAVAKPAAATATFLFVLIILVPSLFLGWVLFRYKTKLDKNQNPSRQTQDALSDLSGNCQLSNVGRFALKPHAFGMKALNKGLKESAKVNCSGANRRRHIGFLRQL
jgi:hypothetical protein